MTTRSRAALAMRSDSTASRKSSCASVSEPKSPVRSRLRTAGCSPRRSVRPLDFRAWMERACSVQFPQACHCKPPTPGASIQVFSSTSRATAKHPSGRRPAWERGSEKCANNWTTMAGCTRSSVRHLAEPNVPFRQVGGTAASMYFGWRLSTR